MGIVEGDVPYYYVTNLQGDVVGINRYTGQRMVTYTYDAWGNVLSITGSKASTLGKINPIRYRGYVYDQETGLYYLQSRYYNPEAGRFLNADVYASTGQGFLGYNMFAYCLNNPVCLNDETGNSPVAVAIGIISRYIAAAIIKRALSVKHDVPLYDQGSLKLCWAFCQVMVEDYQSGNKRTQIEATKRILELAVERNGEENWNKGAWPTNCTEYDIWGTPKAASGINSLFKLFLQVKKGPLYAYYCSNDSAHLVVVTGVDLLQGVVYTNNPWGIAGQQTYAEFLTGFAGGKSDGSYPFRFYITID